MAFVAAPAPAASCCILGATVTGRVTPAGVRVLGVQVASQAFED